MQIRNSVLSLLVLMALEIGPAAAQTFHSKPIQIPGSTDVVAQAINDSNEIVVNYTDAGGTSRCVAIRGTTVIPISDPSEVGTGPGKGTSCWGVNNLGQIVGSYSLDVWGNGFEYSAGTYTDIAVPGATAGTTAYGVNDKGVVVGSFADNVGQHGFTYVVSTKTFKTLNVPGSTVTLAVGINDSEQISLSWVNGGGLLEGALLSGGKYTVLNPPGAAQSEALGINSKGNIVFAGQDSSGAWHGYLYQSGTYTQFDVAGASNTFGAGVNTAGVLVGAYNPVSAPSTSIGFAGVIQ